MRITPSLCELEPRLMKHFFHDPLRLAISDTRYNMFMLKNFGYVRRKLLTTSLGLFPVFFLSNFFYYLVPRRRLRNIPYAANRRGRQRNVSRTSRLIWQVINSAAERKTRPKGTYQVLILAVRDGPQLWSQKRNTPTKADAAPGPRPYLGGEKSPKLKNKKTTGRAN